MKKVEKLLNNSPLTRPSQELDQNAEALFDQALSNSRNNWFEFRVPAWGAIAACIACLFIGRLWVPEPQVQKVTNPPPVLVSETQQPSPVPVKSEPEVFVQIIRHAAPKQTSPFNRQNNSSYHRFSTSWSVTQ